jgi:adenylosuccinate synthase
MSGVVVVGAQWGDEGKGKVVDVLAERSDFVVRFQGGANAGHTLVVNGKKMVLHLIPSGVLRAETSCVIGPGAVIDIEKLVQEIETLQGQNYLSNPKQLLISDSATVIFPFHKALDQAREGSLGNNKIGTTGRGIGPAYEDHAARRAILFGDLFDKPRLKERLDLALKEKNVLLQFYNQKTVTIEEMMNWAATFSEKLAPYRARDVGSIIHKAIKSGKRVLFEGAQGTLLDVYHGTYPYVTSSSTIAGSACIGTGIGPGNISTVIGVMKAYTTRVGQGPFPSELFDEQGQHLQTVGHEFGSTTGRVRRCGWLDLMAMKYSIRLNGITNLALMKLDVLSGLEKIGVCVGYELDGKTLTEAPTSVSEWSRIKPIIEYLPGWKEDLTKISNLKELPRNATLYIDFISKNLGTPVDVISVGPAREQTLWVKPLFAN